MKDELVPGEPVKLVDMRMYLEPPTVEPKAIEPWTGLGSYLVVGGQMEYRDWTLRCYSLATDPQTRIIKIYDEQMVFRNSLTSANMPFSKLALYAQSNIDSRIDLRNEELQNRRSAS